MEHMDEPHTGTTSPSQPMPTLGSDDHQDRLQTTEQPGMEVVNPGSPEKVSYAQHNQQPPLEPAQGPYDPNFSTAGAATASMSAHGFEQPPLGARERTVCGVRRATFILAVLLLVVAIIAAVGGGVGGSIAVDNARKEGLAIASSKAAKGTVSVSTVTSTLTIASYGATPSETGGPQNYVAPQDAMLQLQCPAMDNSQQQINFVAQKKSYTFTAHCGVDYNADTVDIVGVVVYSFQDCIRACADMNRRDNNNTCNAVEFNADMKAIVPDHYATCFLKAKYGKPTVRNINTICGATLNVDGA